MEGILWQDISFWLIYYEIKCCEERRDMLEWNQCRHMYLAYLYIAYTFDVVWWSDIHTMWTYPVWSCVVVCLFCPFVWMLTRIGFGICTFLILVSFRDLEKLYTKSMIQEGFKSLY